MPNVVTGISQDGNVDALTRALQAAKLSLEPLQVIDPGTGVPDFTGSAVPGIGTAPEPEINGDSIWERLSDFEIPDDELESYALALEAGRSVVAYAAVTATVRVVEDAFRASGLANVKTF